MTESFENPATLLPTDEGRVDRKYLIPIFADIRAAISDMLASFGKYLAATTAPTPHWLVAAAKDRRIEPVLYAQVVAPGQPTVRYQRAMFDADAVATATVSSTDKIRLAVIVMLKRAPAKEPAKPAPQIPADEMTDSFDPEVLAPFDLARRQHDGIYWLRTVHYILADVLTATLLELTFGGFLTQSFLHPALSPRWVHLMPGGSLVARILAKQRILVLVKDAASPLPSGKDETLLMGGAHFWDESEHAIINSALAPEQKRLVALWAHTFASWVHDATTGGHWMDRFEYMAPPLKPTLRDIFPFLTITDLRIEVDDTHAEFVSQIPGGRPLDSRRLTQWVYITTPGDWRHVWHPGGRAESDSETRLVTSDRAYEAFYRRIEGVVGIHGHDAV